ncbi:hypothetical protein [Sinomicrobium sp. M5D2P9]
MKVPFVRFLSLVFVVFLSCKQNNSEKELDILSEQNLRLKDSIEKILTAKKRAYLTDSVRVDFSKGILGKLYYSDTLVLSARFADCGEFGGHKEYLKIYSDKEKRLCLFINKSIDCKKSYDDYVKIDSTLFELTKKNEQSILEYLLELTEISMLGQDLSLNYSNDYEMKLNSGLTGEPYFLENPLMHIYFQDQSLRWPQFILLTNEIKTTASKISKP